jgi:hypothetical protein
MRHVAQRYTSDAWMLVLLGQKQFFLPYLITIYTVSGIVANRQINNGSN